jgi:hypothetical protein
MTNKLGMKRNSRAGEVETFLCKAEKRPQSAEVVGGGHGVPQSAEFRSRAKAPPTTVNHRRARLVLVLLLAAFGLLQSAIPLRTAIEVGPDEGFELAKAVLCLNGHHLYTEVWNDQPPLHTFLLTQILGHLSPSILGPRLLTTAFALLLLSALFLQCLRSSGLPAAGATVALLIASPAFLQLASSCMLEIPALAPAVAGLCALVVVPSTNWRAREILCGLLFGVALEIKLIPIVLLPVAGVIVLLQNLTGGRGSPTDELLPRAGLSSTRKRSSLGPPTPVITRLLRVLSGFSARTVLHSMLLVFSALVLTFAALDLVIEKGAFLSHLQQTWSSHFGTARSFEYGSASDHAFDWTVLAKNWDVSLPALLGIVVSLQRSRASAVAALPVAWCTFSLLLFGIHRPWWPYYYVHTAIPLCWCAGVGIAAVWGRLKARRYLWLVCGTYLLCAVPWMAGRLYLQVTSLRDSPQTYNTLVLDDIKRLKPYTQWLYADKQIYSFHTGIPLPPPLGVVMLKRLWSGEMTNARIHDEMWKFKPGLILLANDRRELPFQDLMRAEYRLVYEDADHRLYAEKSVLTQAKAAGTRAIPAQGQVSARP